MIIKRIIKNTIKWAFDTRQIQQAVVMVCIFCGGIAMGAGEESIVASGDGFVLTQKDIAAFQELIDATGAALPHREVVRTALKYELLSREYQKKGGPRPSVDAEAGGSAAEIKIREGSIYILEVLQDYVVSSAVVESYYRSHPKKYSSGKAQDGKYILIPLSEDIKRDIAFAIVEANKEAIVNKRIDALMAEYHVQMQGGL